MFALPPNKLINTSIISRVRRGYYDIFFLASGILINAKFYSETLIPNSLALALTFLRILALTSGGKLDCGRRARALRT